MKSDVAASLITHFFKMLKEGSMPLLFLFGAANEPVFLFCLCVDVGLGVRAYLYCLL